MEKIRELELFAKIVLLVMAAMVLVFTVIYPIVTSREGILYSGAILVPEETEGTVTYSGKINGEPASVTVAPDHTAEFRIGDRYYGPYTARENPESKPAAVEYGFPMTGIDLYCGDEIVFRGGIADFGDSVYTFNQDGSIGASALSWIESDGTAYDLKGDVIDRLAPSSPDILKLMYRPVLTHRGDWRAWFLGLVICIITALFIVFADKLFRWQLSFRIRHADEAEPSEWELAGRYISWVVMPVAALITFLIGLR